MSRRDRQQAELRALCRSGAVAHAVDLAFAHFADFGRDDDLMTVLTDAIGRTPADPGLQRALAQLSECR